MQSLVPNRTRTRSNQKEQYGIDMGNILSTKSNLKTANLKQEAMQSTLDTEEEEDVAYGNQLVKSGKAELNAIDENGDGKIDADEKKNALREAGRSYGAHSKMRKDDDASANIKNTIANRNARTGIAQSKENRQAREAKEKHERWRSENKKADKRISDMAKVTTDARLRAGDSPEVAEAIGNAKVAEVDAYVTKIKGTSDSKQEQAITISNTVQRQYSTLIAEKDPKKQTAMIAEGKKKAEGDKRVADATGTPENIELANENLERFNKITDENGNADPAKLMDEYKKVLISGSKIKADYSERKSKERLTASQAGTAERGNKRIIASEMKELRLLAEAEAKAIKDEGGYDAEGNEITAEFTRKETNNILLEAGKKIKRGVDARSALEEAKNDARGETGAGNQTKGNAPKKKGKITEGSTSTSKGRPIIYKNGAWKYND